MNSKAYNLKAIRLDIRQNITLHKYRYDVYWVNRIPETELELSEFDKYFDIFNLQIRVFERSPDKKWIVCGMWDEIDSPDGNKRYKGNLNHTICYFNASDGTMMHFSKGHRDDIVCCINHVK